jgi:hypothetical protein
MKKYYFAPTGFINIRDAIENIANIPEYTAFDLEYLDIGDRLNDAKALDAATKKLRQALCDGHLKAYTMDSAGVKRAVPIWDWANDEACLDDQSTDVQFNFFRFFHAKGIKLENVRKQVFITEESLTRFLTNAPNPAVKKPTKKAGRPKGSGSFDDETWLGEMEKIIIDKGISPWAAAQSIVSDNADRIERKQGVLNEAVESRLYKKYKLSSRTGSPSD